MEEIEDHLGEKERDQLELVLQQKEGLQVKTVHVQRKLKKTSRDNFSMANLVSELD